MDFSHIILDPAVCQGKPHIKGTRLSVELLQAQRATGWSETNIRETYPYLSDDEIRQALTYSLQN